LREFSLLHILFAYILKVRRGKMGARSLLVYFWLPFRWQCCVWNFQLKLPHELLHVCEWRL